MELSDPDNRHLLGGHQSEMMISPMIVSHVLAQVALRRELRVVLEKVVAVKGEVAMGIWRYHADRNGHHVALNPPRDVYLDLTSNDRLIVLCRS